MGKRAHWIVAAFLIVGHSTLALTQQSISKIDRPFMDNREVLKELSVRLATLSQLIKKVDVAKLAVEYREGDIIEKRRKLTEKEIERVLVAVDMYLKNGPTLESAVVIVFELKDLEEYLSGLSGSLNNLITAKDKASIEQGISWVEKLTDSEAEIAKSSSLLEMRARAVLMTADKMLEPCKPR